MNIDETLKNNLIADVENICDITLDVGFKTSLKRAFEITIGHHFKAEAEEEVSDEDIENDITDMVLDEYGHNAISEHYHIIEQRVIGAKAMRDNKIPAKEIKKQ